MTANQVRELLATTLPDRQPVSLTPQQLVAAGRRRLRRRRAGYLGASTAAVALLVAGGLLLPPALTGAPGPDGPPGPAARPPAASPPPGADQLVGPEASAATDRSQDPVALLSAEVRTLFAAAAPDLQLHPAEREREPLELADPGEGLADLAGMAYLVTGEELAGWVEVRLYRPGGGWSDQPGTSQADHYQLEDPAGNPALISCWSGSFDVSVDSDPPVTTTGIVETQCDTSTAADGVRLITAQGREYYQGVPLEQHARSWHTVVAYRPDGTAVKVENFCGNDADDDDETNHCTGLRFSIDQLASIVADIPPVPAE